MHQFWYLIATFGGIGRLPKMPGTWASIAALPLVFWLMKFGPLVYMTSVFIVLLLGIFACNWVEKTRETHDQGDLVIDEVVGILITMTWLPITWQSFVLGLLLFRLLDIWKPFPVSFLDRRIKGGLGVMLDDVAAGMIANLILQVVFTKTNWLGSQLVTL